jgi:hypothetical protein
VGAVGLQPGMQGDLTAALRGFYEAFLMTPNITPPADDEFALHLIRGRLRHRASFRDAIMARGFEAST